MFKRVLVSILAVAILLMLMPAAYSADTPGLSAAFESFRLDAEGLQDNDALLDAYLAQRIFTADSLAAPAAALRGDFLPPAERAVYDALAEQIQKVAANGGKTVFTLDVTGKGVNFEILGTDETGRYIGKFCLDAEQIILSLQNDFPYDLYWYDLMRELSFGTTDGIPVGKEPGTVIALKTLVFTFPVAVAFQDEKGEDPQHTVSAKAVKTAQAAKANADAVIQNVLDHREEWGVEQQLRHCFEFIKNSVSYDDSQHNNLNTWQMIWVFDQDDSTNVVCEGYAKAFKYLCDGIGIENYLVSGTMRTPGDNESVPSSKDHMWNILVLNGCSYLVDVTNCDDKSIGKEDKLFLKAPDAGGSEAQGYVFSKAHSVRYAYSADVLAALGGTGILSLHEEDYRDTELSVGEQIVVELVAAEQDGAAIAEISDSLAENILKQAEKSKGMPVVLAPVAGNGVKNLQVSMSGAFLATLGSETNADVILRTSFGNVTIPNSALSAFAGKTGTVVVGIEKDGDRISVNITVDDAAVAALDGGITLQIPCTNPTPATVAMLVREDGSREVIRKAVTVNGVLCIPLDGSATIVRGENTKNFTDVSTAVWYYDAVAFASSHLLFSGTSETTFAPDGTMTRGMLAKVLHNLEGNPNPEFNGSFPDVKQGSWYETAVLWAAGEGIVSGYSNGLYGPNDDITREQLAVMLWRYCGSPKSNHSLGHFSDSAKISGYAREAMSWANEKGVINGTGDGRLDPSGKASRAQVAQMLKNFLEKI